MRRILQGLGIGFLAILLVVGSVLLVSPAAITQLAGIALAITPTNWTPLQDASLGDGLSRGVMNPYVFNGTTFDRLRGDSINGALVEISTFPGGTQTVALDMVIPVNPIPQFITYQALFDGTTSDPRHNAEFATTNNPTDGSGAALSGIVGFNEQLTAPDQWERIKSRGQHLTVENYGNYEARGGLVSETSTGANNTAVSFTITAGASFSHTHVHHVSAFCDSAAAGTAQITIASVGGAGNYWISTALIGTALFTQNFPTAVVNPDGETNTTVTLSSCGAGSAGTLNVLGGNHQR